jgi:hypothetical protein
MNRRLRSRLLFVGLSALLLGRAPAASADGRPEVGTPEATAEARAHFTRGKELYQAGSYREAIVELDAARALDPKAKDLVFNLAIVHEKLAEVDEALRYARLYLEMDLEPAERTRAEGYIKRLEGAKSELDARKAATATPGPHEAERVRGRLDAATITVGVLALGAAGAGTAFGVKALGDKVSPSYVTGPTAPYSGLQHLVSTAHTEAVVSDVCFAGAIVAAGVAAGLYFGRFRDAPAPAESGAPKTGLLSAAPLLGPGTGGVVLGGAF